MLCTPWPEVTDLHGDIVREHTPDAVLDDSIGLGSVLSCHPSHAHTSLMVAHGLAGIADDNAWPHFISWYTDARLPRWRWWWVLGLILAPGLREQP